MISMAVLLPVDRSLRRRQGTLAVKQAFTCDFYTTTCSEVSIDCTIGCRRCSNTAAYTGIAETALPRDKTARLNVATLSARKPIEGGAPPRDQERRKTGSTAADRAACSAAPRLCTLTQPAAIDRVNPPARRSGGKLASPGNSGGRVQAGTLYTDIINGKGSRMSDAVHIHPSVDSGVKPGAASFNSGTLVCKCTQDPVKVRIEGSISYDHACGCTKCWKPAGADFSIVAVVPRDKLSVTAEREQVAGRRRHRRDPAPCLQRLRRPHVRADRKQQPSVLRI